MHEFELINKYFSKLSSNNKNSLKLNDDVFFDKSKISYFCRYIY